MDMEMMVFNYYPGCTLKTKAKDLDITARKVAERLGVKLNELPEWQCCGGAYPLAEDEIATKLSSVRALMSAKQSGGTLVTLCSACHNVIKQVNNDMRTNDYIATRVNNYIKPEEEYHGETEVIHYLEMLRDKVGFEKIAETVGKDSPLKGKKIAAYYGCLLLRPSKVMRMDDPENPTIMENLIKAAGAEPVVYAMRNECCGGYVMLESEKLAKNRCNLIIENAKAQGAEIIVTACPLCLYNLKKSADGAGIQVRYFTEILAEALNIE